MKRIVAAALIGWVVMSVWVFVVNGIYGFRHSIDMKEVPDDRQLYADLKRMIAEPGRYMVNPTQIETGFPANEPVYSIQYSGIGHEAAGRGETVNLILGLAACLIATWMLSRSTDRVLASYIRRVLFFFTIGLFLVVAVELPKCGIGGYPMSDAIKLAVSTLVQWTVVGLVVGMILRPAVDKIRVS